MCTYMYMYIIVPCVWDKRIWNGQMFIFPSTRWEYLLSCPVPHPVGGSSEKHFCHIFWWEIFVVKCKDLDPSPGNPAAWCYLLANTQGITFITKGYAALVTTSWSDKYNFFSELCRGRRQNLSVIVTTLKLIIAHAVKRVSISLLLRR